ncbi:putative B6 ABC transporter permease subunit 2 [Brucella thiophenivorans]|uniref:Branched-chain amino acid transport system / permease component family protein n=1 Tax=Brucella thiophenivorans TaxID=571255 RepID=A0A256F9J4_9HYPH|nr:ABC transporter permease [Brucella thiophenivorans]OYR11410.1 branched-chain amino acid transport system / permease component family protein [Brucella thiophenivorans]
MSDQQASTAGVASATMRSPFSAWSKIFAVSVGPLVAALVLGGLILLAMGVNPLNYYGYVVERAILSPSGLSATLTRMGPFLLIAASLIVAFRAGIWNLGGDGQFLLAAVIVAATTPLMHQAGLPIWLNLAIGLVIGLIIGALWGLLPAMLKAWHGINEIITTLMMSFLGVSLANVLVKLAFLDPATTTPQTRTLPVDARLPKLFDTTISSGLIIGLVVIIAMHLMMTRTSFGMKLRLVGANPRAAVHAGLSVPKLTIAVFAISAGLAGLSGAVDILGTQGNVRADWNPAYSLTVVPLVFLARLNGFGSIAYVFLFSALTIGGESAARRLGVPSFFSLVIVALLLITLALAEYIDKHRQYRAKF